MIVSASPQVESQPDQKFWVWALIPVIALLAYHAPRIAGVDPSFGFLAQIAIGVWMARRFGRQGLAAFAVACLLVSTPLRDDWGRIGNALTDNLVAVIFAWLTANDTRSLLDSIIDRAAVIRQWRVFWPLLTLGLIYVQVVVLVGTAIPGPVLSLWFDGTTILTLLALVLGLAGAGGRLFTALFLLFAVLLVGDFMHSAACDGDMLPKWACLTQHEFSGLTHPFSIEFTMRASRGVPLLGGLAAAYGIGIFVRRWARGEEMHHALMQAPAKVGLVVLVLGIGFGRHAALQIFDSFPIVLAGSYSMTLVGAFLLGSRLGYRGVALAAAVYVGTMQVPGFIDWWQKGDFFGIRLWIGVLFDCILAALIGARIRYRPSIALDAPRRFETATLFAALWTLFLGFVDLQSEVGLLWLAGTTLAAALVVLVIRFREESAQAGGVAVTVATDILIVIAMLVFVKDHVPGIIEALLNLGESFRPLETGTQISGFEAMLVKAQQIPIQVWLFFLCLLFLLDVYVLYGRVRRMVRELPAFMHVLTRRAGVRRSE